MSLDSQSERGRSLSGGERRCRGPVEIEADNCRTLILQVEPALPISTGNAEEDARMQAFHAQNVDQWEQMQEDMSS